MASPKVRSKNLDIYGDKPMPWSRARRQLNALSKSKSTVNRTHWLATTGPKGRPHVAGVGAMWVDDRFYVVSGPKTVKSRNLARQPRCVIAVMLPDLDLVVEGKARRVTDEKTLKRLARRYNTDGGWPARVEGRAFTAPYSAPSAGRPPWYLYAITPTTAFGVATKKPYGAMRWRFKAAR